jgi:hypothetical protein
MESNQPTQDNTMNTKTLLESLPIGAKITMTGHRVYMDKTKGLNQSVNWTATKTDTSGIWECDRTGRSVSLDRFTDYGCVYVKRSNPLARTIAGLVCMAHVDIRVTA